MRQKAWILPARYPDIVGTEPLRIDLPKPTFR